MPGRPKSGGKAKKEKPKPPKVQIKELTEANEALTQELNTLKNESEQLRNRLTAVNSRMIAATEEKILLRNGVSKTTNPVDIHADSLINLIERLIVKRKIQDVSVEARVEDLESRLTDVTFDLAKMTKKTFAYECGLEDLKQCSSLEECKDRVYNLQIIAGQAYHDILASDEVHTSRNFAPVNGINGVDDSPSDETQLVMEMTRTLNLVPPAKKQRGEVTVSEMNRDLRLFIIKELSQEKTSGADWRMIATRVGIEEAKIKEWRDLDLRYPMGRVFDQWQRIGGASMRMLHRHLMSPQLRCTLLGKRVADFYEVD